MIDSELVQIAAVIPAAGRGKRMGAGRSKGLLTLAGRPLLLHALAPLVESAWLDCLVVVAPAEELDAIAETLDAELPSSFPAAVVPGGAERADSVRAGLEWLASWDGWQAGAGHLVAIHDAARPLLSMELWQRVLLAAVREGAAVPGMPVVDTLKRVDEGGRITGTLDRNGIWQVQTPQVFTFDEILAAHRRIHQAGEPVTDDAQVWELSGRPLRMVEGDRENIKVTTPADLLLAEAILRRRGEELACGPGL